jgi:hypothetical protein
MFCEHELYMTGKLKHAGLAHEASRQNVPALGANTFIGNKIILSTPS